MKRDYRPLDIEDIKERLPATRYREDFESCLSLRTEQILRLAHAEGLLYTLLRRVGWQGSRCTCGCEEARFSSHPDYRPIVQE